MIKTYKFRIYPSNNQEVKLISTLNTCRWLYNSSLDERKHQAEINKLYSYLQLFPFGKPEWINYYDQAKNLTLYKTDEQKQIYSQVIRDVLKRLDRSFKNFFNGYGYPRFQGRNRYDSFTYPQKGFSITDEGKLNLYSGNYEIDIDEKHEILKEDTQTSDEFLKGLTISMSNHTSLKPLSEIDAWVYSDSDVEKISFYFELDPQTHSDRESLVIDTYGRVNLIKGWQMVNLSVNRIVWD